LGVPWVVVTPEISEKQVREFQAENPDLGPAIDWMTEGQTPSADIPWKPGIFEDSVRLFICLMKC